MNRKKINNLIYVSVYCLFLLSCVSALLSLGHSEEVPVKACAASKDTRSLPTTS